MAYIAKWGEVRADVRFDQLDYAERRRVVEALGELYHANATIPYGEAWKARHRHACNVERFILGEPMIAWKGNGKDRKPSLKPLTRYTV